jgi:signal transduction histidine kinase
LIHFGGLNGLISFNPKNLYENHILPKPQLIDLKVFNESIPIIENLDDNEIAHLDKNIVLLDSVTFSHENNNITIGFSALDLTEPHKNRYIYRLAPIHKDWIYIDTKNTVSFSRLDLGEYTFQLKATNSDGLWSEKSRDLKIYILKPVWRKWWFLLLLTVLLFLVLYFFVEWRTYQLAKDKSRLEKIISERTKELDLKNKQLIEFDQIKSNFFTNISHELRTPLTLIISPLKSIVEENISSTITKKLNPILNNSNRLLRLINQLLDFSKLEAGKMELKTENCELLSFFSRIVDSFDSYAKSQEIQLSFKNLEQETYVQLDTDKIEKILYNLISNAIKFEKKPGFVNIEIIYNIINEKEASAQILIQNMGNTIDNEEIEHIFKRFYQSDRQLS